MSFRVPYQLLSDDHKSQIQKDLTIKEKPKYFQFTKKPIHKEIKFYSYDSSTGNVVIPLYYACQLFQKPFINQRRSFHQVPPFQVTATLRDYQEEVVSLALTDLFKYGSTFLNVFCSFGKTVVAAYLAAMISQKYNLCTLVTYPIKILKDSWAGTFHDRTNAKVFVVGETPGPPDPDVQVFICMDTQFSQLDPAILNKIGYFIVDEADCYCTSGRSEALLSTQPLFTTLLTATYERDDGMEVMLDLLNGPHRITRISTRPFFVLNYVTSYDVEPEVGPHGIKFNNLVEQYDSIEQRNLLILQMVLDNLSEKILILTFHVEHATNLHTWLTHYLQPYNKTCSLIAGNIKRYADASVIVGTTKKMGRGTDEEKSCFDWKGERINMLILASSTKKIEQIAGRVFRAEIPIIVDIVDNHKNVKAHWGTRRKWYNSRNGIILPVNNRFIWKDMWPSLMTEYFQRLKQGIPINPKVPDESQSIASEHAKNIINRLKSLSQA